jgi:NitT/TauT family transport system permease protein
MKDFIIKDKYVIFKKIAIALFWIGIWQVAYWIIGRDIYVPSPFSVFVALYELVQQPSFWKTVFFSIYRVAVGLLLSIVLGVFFGILAGLHSLFYEVMRPMMSAIKSTPVISFIIIALLWFSSTNVPIFISFLLCFPIVWTNIIAGIHNVDAKLLEMAKIYRVKPLAILRHIYLPSIMPYFSAAVLTAFGLGWKVSVTAEVLSHPRNAIGSNLHSAKAYLDTPALFAWTFVVIVLSILFESFFAIWIKGKRRSA